MRKVGILGCALWSAAALAFTFSWDAFVATLHHDRTGGKDGKFIKHNGGKL